MSMHDAPRDRISNSEDVIDLRDVIARVETLRKLRQPGPVDLGTLEDNEADQDSLFEELRILEALLNDCKGNGGDEQWEGDWYPVTLIRDSYFEDYAREMAEDIGAIGRDMQWPLMHIDWNAAADALKMDYTSVDYDNVIYWTR